MVATVQRRRASAQTHRSRNRTNDRRKGGPAMIRIHRFSAWKRQLFAGVLATASSLSAVAQHQPKEGAATADLRGLGPNRTLVLVDGRRLGQGSPNTAIQSPAPDLDQIPAGLVDRIEVFTGGASAAYGSDAIAGVINFIMKRDFQGVQFDGQ